MIPDEPLKFDLKTDRGRTDMVICRYGSYTTSDGYDTLRVYAARLERRLERAEKALRAIQAAPGGGPGKRIAAQALAGGEHEETSQEKE